MADIRRFDKFIVMPGKERVAKKKPIDTALPGIERVEKLRAKRKPSIETLREELAHRPTGFVRQFFEPAVTGLKALDVGRERVEGALTPILAATQEIQDPETGFAESPLELTRRGGPLQAIESIRKRAKFVKGVGEKVVAGVRGETQAEIGDIPRRAGFTEPVSAFIGAGALAGITDVAVGKTLTKAVSTLGRGIKTAVSGGRTKVFNAVEDVVEGIDTAFDVTGRQVGNVFKSSIGKKPVDMSRLKPLLDSLPENILKKLKGRDARKLFKIKFGETGKIVNTKENLWRVRRFLDDHLTAREFAEGTTKAGKDSIMKARNLIRGLLEEGDPQVAKVMGNYSQLSNDYAFLKSLFTEKGRPAANKLIDLFKIGGGAEPAKLKALSTLAKFVPQTSKVVKDAIALNRLITAGKVTAGAAGASLVFGLARKLTDPIVSAVSGDGDTPPGLQ